MAVTFSPAVQAFLQQYGGKPTRDQWAAFLTAHPEEARDSSYYALVSDPNVQRAMATGATTTVQVGETKVKLENGRMTAYSVGSAWKPILAAGATAAGGYALGSVLGGGSAAASGATPGAVGTSGTSAAAVSPHLAGDLALEAGGSPIVQGANPSTLSKVGSWLSGTLSNPFTLAGLASAGANIYATHSANAASEKAAEAQLQATREAINYEKQKDAYLQNLEASRYADLTGRLQPYIGAGQSASDRQLALMGLTPTAPIASAPPPPMNPFPAIPPGHDQRGPATPGSDPISVAVPRVGTPTTPNATTVRLLAPDGSQRDVAAADVGHYLSRGAQVVG